MDVSGSAKCVTLLFSKERLVGAPVVSSDATVMPFLVRDRQNLGAGTAPALGLRRTSGSVSGGMGDAGRTRAA